MKLKQFKAFSLCFSSAQRTLHCSRGWYLIYGRCFGYVPAALTWAAAEVIKSFGSCIQCFHIFTVIYLKFLSLSLLISFVEKLPAPGWTPCFCAPPLRATQHSEAAMEEDTHIYKSVAWRLWLPSGKHVIIIPQSYLFIVFMEF